MPAILTGIALLTSLLITLTLEAAPLSVEDSSGSRVTLATPAQRIISLAPHLTELLFAAGAGEKVVGVVSYSDYPEEAQTITRVGNYQTPDFETILALSPDLVTAWGSGTGPAAISRLRSLGLTVYVNEPHRLAEIADTIEKLGHLTGTELIARQSANRFRERLNTLHRRYARRRPVTTFYQIWHQPLMSIGEPHLLSRVIELCGGRNAFIDVDVPIPTLTIEAVIATDPEAIIGSGMATERPEWLDAWHRWPQLRAVRNDHLYAIHPDLLHRPTPRLLDGAEQMCERLEQVRTGGKQ